MCGLALNRVWYGRPMDWLAFALGFVFAALPTFLVVAGLAWRLDPWSSATSILAIAAGAALVAGLLTGVSRGRASAQAAAAAARVRLPRRRKAAG